MPFWGLESAGYPAILVGGKNAAGVKAVREIRNKLVSRHKPVSEIADYILNECKLSGRRR